MLSVLHPLIRSRSVDDVAACVGVLAQVHANGGYPSNWPDDAATWLTPPDCLQAWVAVDEAGTVLGHAMVRAPASLSRFFIAPDAQGLGLGRRLLTHATEWGLAHRRHLILEVDEGREAAIRLYERGGWHRTRTSVADWAGPTGEPVVLFHYSVSRETWRP